MPPSKGAEVSTPSGEIVYCFFEFHLIIALSASASLVITIDYKGKTELPYNPPQAMLLHAGRGQVGPFSVDIGHFPFPYRLRASHTRIFGYM